MCFYIILFYFHGGHGNTQLSAEISVRTRSRSPPRPQLHQTGTDSSKVKRWRRCQLPVCMPVCVCAHDKSTRVL